MQDNASATATVRCMEITGAHVVGSAWLVALAVILAAGASRRALLLGLGTGPVLGLGWMVLVAREGNTVTRADRVVLMIACALGACLAVAPVAYVHWVRHIFREANRRVPSN